MSATMRPPSGDWATDFDHLDPRWSNDPYPIWAELLRSCPVAHTERFMGAISRPPMRPSARWPMTRSISPRAGSLSGTIARR